ncbi:MAG: class I SAM-dependent methyltransferase [Fidelibacterota bacterium]
MNYYTNNLSGDRLRECYAIAPQRIKQYLDAEIKYIISHTRPQDSVLELGCGYGRVTSQVCGYVKKVTGIDTSTESLELARSLQSSASRCAYIEMDATKMSFLDESYDVVFCIQNGICAFGVDKSNLIKEAVRVTKPGGKTIFSSYSSHIWTDRLKWFEYQAAEGLIGKIDYENTSNGNIVCKDGFKAGSLNSKEFQALCNKLGLKPVITEIDSLSIMCMIIK